VNLFCVLKSFRIFAIVIHKYIAEMKHLKFLISLFAFLVVVGCNSNSKGNNDKSNNEGEAVKVNGLTYDKAFEIVDVETGWKGASQPFIKIKIRNISGKPITESVEVKYAFIKDDEIIDNTSHYIHGSSDVAWDNGLCVTEELSSITRFSGTITNGIPTVKAKVLFIDDTPIWEGEISKKVTAY
jgi:hypothetical protein